MVADERPLLALSHPLLPSRSLVLYLFPNRNIS